MLTFITIFVYIVITAYIISILLCWSWLLLSRTKKGIWYKAPVIFYDVELIVLSLCPGLNSIEAIELWKDWPTK